METNQWVVNLVAYQTGCLLVVSVAIAGAGLVVAFVAQLSRFWRLVAWVSSMLAATSFIAGYLVLGGLVGVAATAGTVDVYDNHTRVPALVQLCLFVIALFGLLMVGLRAAVVRCVILLKLAA